MSYLGDFPKDIKKFNEMYKLPSTENLRDLGHKRIEEFMSILIEEIKEGEIIADSLNPDIGDSSFRPTGVMDDVVAAAIADWLGDIIVYCASEALRWGIPMDRTLQIIMKSNFSKLGLDGQPIYDSRGKVLKGPNFYPPEPELEAMLATNHGEV